MDLSDDDLERAAARLFSAAAGPAQDRPANTLFVQLEASPARPASPAQPGSTNGLFAIRKVGLGARD